MWLLTSLLLSIATILALPLGLGIWSSGTSSSDLEIHGARKAHVSTTVDLKSSPPAARVAFTVAAYASDGSSRSKVTITSETMGRLSACREGSTSRAPILPVRAMRDGRFAIDIPIEAEDRFHGIFCDVPDLLRRDLGGWSMSTPRLKLRRSQPEAVTESCLATRVSVVGYSASATLTARPVPAREPLDNVLWAASTNTEKLCFFPLMHHEMHRGAWDVALVEDDTDISSANLYGTALLGPATLRVEEPSMATETNARLFLCGILASLAASAAFAAIQSVGPVRELPTPQPGPLNRIPRNHQIRRSSPLLAWPLCLGLILFARIMERKRDPG